MRELSSRASIVAKGFLFLALAGVTGTLLLLQAPGWRTAAILAVLVWASCRFYYFLFYALQRYVDPGLRYAGVLGLLRQILRDRGRR